MATSQTLADLPSGKCAIVESLPQGVHGMRRLCEMGVLPGTRICLIRRAPFGNAIEISVRGTLLSLRREEAEKIEIRPDKVDYDD